MKAFTHHTTARHDVAASAAATQLLRNAGFRADGRPKGDVKSGQWQLERRVIANGAFAGKHR